MKKIDEAKSILTLHQTVIDKLSFERFSGDVKKLMTRDKLISATI